MFIIQAPVEEIIELDNQIFLMKICAPKIASIIKPGQFLNIRVSETTFPLLRRPFSVCNVEGDSIFIMFNILGEGTRILAHKKIGDVIDILGPLGNGFNLKGEFTTAIIVAGGLGASPFPYFIKELNPGKKVYCFIGGRTHKDVITYGMKNIYTSTDDGSLGLKGNVIDLLSDCKDILSDGVIKVFACGPNAMLRALKKFSIENNLECEASTECAMACGFGICQGCPIESAHQKDKYLLVCKDGPVFNVRDVII